ncbi:MAG: hypothetical protein RL341_361 [Pseudomonadota bacterium]
MILRHLNMLYAISMRLLSQFCLKRRMDIAYSAFDPLSRVRERVRVRADA